MVQLIGVMHALIKRNFFGGCERLPVYPTDGLINKINEFPDKSRVGIEWFKHEDFKDICDDLSRLCEESALDYVGFQSDEAYWVALRVRLKSSLEIVFLEEKDLWLRINKAVIEEARKRGTDQQRRKDESVLAHRKRITTQDYDAHMAYIDYKRLHEIERDDKFLEVIKSGLDVVISGIGHTDYWWANREAITKKSGIVFDGYSTEEIFGDANCDSEFVECAVPDPERVFSRIGLERSIRLIEKGKLIEKGEPFCVGTWSIIEPAKGYFEVYVDKRQSNRLSGRIEDCFGSATFEGMISGDELVFTKKYDWTACKPDTIKTPISYKAKRFGNKFCGYWFHNFGGNAFYMIRKPKENPINLALGLGKVLDNTTNLDKVKSIKRD